MVFYPDEKSPFCNAIKALEHDRHPDVLTHIHTYLSRFKPPAIKVQRNLNVRYVELREDARRQINLDKSIFNPEDFYINPMGFELEVPDNWEEFERPILGEFIIPMHMRFTPGLLCKRVSNFIPKNHIGQFTPTKVAENDFKVHLWVGSSIKPIAIITQTPEGAYDVQTKGVPHIFSQKEDVLREAIRLALIHKESEPFTRERTAYIREILGGILPED